MKQSYTKTLLFMSLLLLFIAQVSAEYTYTKAGIYTEYNAIQADKYLTVSTDLLKDGQCLATSTYEWGISWNYMYYNSQSYAIGTLAWSGGYFQTNDDAWVIALVSADIMNYLRGNVESKLSGIKMRNGDKAFEYAQKVYEKYAPRVREDVQKDKIARRHQFCKWKKDLYVWSPGKSVFLSKKYYAPGIALYAKNSWDKWEKTGENRKILGYVIYMLLMESVQNEPGEFYHVIRGY